MQVKGIALLCCIDNYCKASGKVVNFNKSCALFSKNVGSEEQNRLADLFGVTLVANVGSYLGCPLIRGI